MKTNKLIKLLSIGILGLLLAAGCSGKNGSTGKTGATGAQGALGNEGPANPTVSWVMPVQGATGVYTDSVIKVGFSKPISSSTINSSTFMVSTGGIPVTGSISYNSGSQTAFFDPNIPLYQFGFYTATLTTGILETDGKALAANYTWMFIAGGSSTPAVLYATDFNNLSLDVFYDAGSASGNVAPDRRVSGAATTFNTPVFLWLDKGSDRLYISDAGTGDILVFNNASTVNGNIAPNRTISSASLSLPYGIWLDASTDTLYVVDGGNNAVLAFDNVSTLNGAVSASRSISGSNTTLNSPVGISLDAANDDLYIVNWGNNSILVFNNASTATGNIAPSRTISGSNTGLSGPQGIWLDATSDQLYVADQFVPGITVYNNASTANGNITPSRTISGASTGFNSTTGVWYDASTNRLYVADQVADSISIFNSGNTANGDIAPSRVIAGANTHLNGTKTIWLDMNP
ncbi:MAG: Ig-like domain-containing protein [Deltaproteobacteria bacterium]|nr:Ig-like domain-containing protein [Deltaproteobacteria bacterium]